MGARQNNKKHERRSQQFLLEEKVATFCCVHKHTNKHTHKELKHENLKFCDLIFARQLLWSSGKVNLPISGDRITPLIDYIRDILLPMSGSNAFSGVYFETPDTDSSKELSGFCKSLARPLENGLNKLRLLPTG
jgi:23S rRNA C2498 (ribose-2'-O)-methylase RlmM